MRYVSTLVLAILAALMLAACNQPAATPTAVPVAPEPTAAAPTDAYPGPATDAYPGPGAAATEPYPAPVDPNISMDPIVVPAPASNEVGVVTGTIFRLTQDGQRVPFAGGVLYLGTILATDTGVEAMVAVNKEVAPQGSTNGLGQFAIADVPPGRYGLMLETVQGTVLLNDPSGANDGDLIIEVTGGDTIDLGELAYPLPEQ
jgi:hypothetical protein